MFRKQSAFRTSPSCGSIFSCCKNRKRLILVWILPWIVLVGFGFMLLMNFVGSSKPKEAPPAQTEFFDWVDVEWDFSTPKVQEPERLTPKFYGFLIDPVRDAYLYPPQPVKVGYAIVKNCTFDTHGYYIKDGMRYPTQHSWLIPQFEIEEAEPIRHYVDKCICLYVPMNFNEMGIIIKIMPRILALPEQALRTLPIFTNCDNEIITKIFSDAGFNDLNINLMTGSVNAKEMYVLDYPETNTYPYADFASFKSLLGRSLGTNEPPNNKITIDKMADTRLADVYAETLAYYHAVDGKIEPVDVFNRSPENLMRFFQTQSCFVSYGTYYLNYAAFMRPKSKLIIFSNMLDVIEGAQYAMYSGVQIHVIGSRNRTITPKSREYVLKVIERECSETHIANDDDDDTPPLKLDDIDSPDGEKEIIEKQKEILSKVSQTIVDGKMEFQKEKMKSETIVGEVDDE